MNYFFLSVLMSLSQVLGGPLNNCPGRYQIDPAVTRFRRYIQIDTSKSENINRAVEFWRAQAVELGLPFSCYSPGGLPVCVLTVLGSDPSLPSIMLNSHMDVVPALENEWIYPPYSAYMDEKGDIYGRGTQDAKDVSCQYVEAVRRMKQNGVMLKRNLHITFMPDEETGGFNGMKKFINTEAFKAMNIGFVLDEGLSSEDDSLFVTYQDRRPWREHYPLTNSPAELQVTTHGEGGHGSGMPDNTAIDKARRFMNVVSGYRERMKSVMRSAEPTDFGGYTSVNINIVTGGYRPNIIPSDFGMVVDMRLAVDTNITEMEQMVQSWIVESATDTEFKFLRRDDVSKRTVLDDSNPYWVAMRNAVNEMDMIINPVVGPATSDSMVLRNMGIPAVGFAPKTQTQLRIHGKNEYLNADVFLQGINIMYEVLMKLGSVPTPEEGRQSDIKIVPVVLAATSDSLVLRNLGLPAVGFSAKTSTIVRVHASNEYLNAGTFLRGIDVYSEILQSLGNLPEFQNNMELSVDF